MTILLSILLIALSIYILSLNSQGPQFWLGVLGSLVGGFLLLKMLSG
jgi:hypothetical protein